ncbi:MAG: hypothetical protein Q8Q49_01940, partial [bacterium]|nr:hypothetical protein [bacterium]
MRYFLLIIIFFSLSSFFNQAVAQVCSGGGDFPIRNSSCLYDNIDKRYECSSYTFYNYSACTTLYGGCTRQESWNNSGICTNGNPCDPNNMSDNFGTRTDAGCYWDYGSSQDSGYGDSGYGDSGYGDGGYAPPPTATPTRTPTPSPTPRPDLAVSSFKLVGADGKEKAIDPFHWDLPLFYTGEDVCPVVTLRNLSITPSVSSTNYTWTAFYSDGSGTTPPAFNTESDVDIYLKNGQFGSKFSKTYAAYDTGTNNTYYTYKTGANGGEKCWPAAAGRKHSWVYMNY